MKNNNSRKLPSHVLRHVRAIVNTAVQIRGQDDYAKGIRFGLMMSAKNLVSVVRCYGIN